MLCKNLPLVTAMSTMALNSCNGRWQNDFCSEKKHERASIVSAGNDWTGICNVACRTSAANDVTCNSASNGCHSRLRTSWEISKKCQLICWRLVHNVCGLLEYWLQLLLRVKDTKNAEKSGHNIYITYFHIPFLQFFDMDVWWQNSSHCSNYQLNNGPSVKSNRDRMRKMAANQLKVCDIKLRSIEQISLTTSIHSAMESDSM